MPDKYVNLLLWIIGGCMTIVSTLFGVVWRRQTKLREQFSESIEDIRDTINTVDKNLADHKLTVEKEYPRTETVEKMLKPLNDNILEVKSDVKSLINRELDKHDKR